jgi:hypothetical protein
VSQNYGESEIERLFREEAARIWPAVPELVQECRVTACGSNYHLDFAIPSMMLGVELDGWETHSSPTQIAYDRRKKRDLEDAGWRVRYYGGQEVWASAGYCVRDVLRWAGLEPVQVTTEPFEERFDWREVIRAGGVFDAGEPTDQGNARAVLARSHAVLRYDPGTGRWLVRGASGWQADDGGEGDEDAIMAVLELRDLMPDGCADPENDPRFAHLDPVTDAAEIAALKRQAKNYERFGSATVRDIARVMKAVAARAGRKEAA